jgi:hypothetical protein
VPPLVDTLSGRSSDGDADNQRKERAHYQCGRQGQSLKTSFVVLTDARLVKRVLAVSLINLYR